MLLPIPALRSRDEPAEPLSLPREVSVETVYAVLDEDGEYAEHGGAQHAGAGEAGAADDDPAANGSADDDRRSRTTPPRDTGGPEADATGIGRGRRR